MGRVLFLLSMGLVLHCFSFAQTYPIVNWTFPLNTPSFGSACAADVDDDGKLEIIFTTYTNDGHAYCLNAEDGSVLWSYDLLGCSDVAPVIYDLDGDDTLDVFFNGSCNANCYAVNAHTGQLLWTKSSGGGDSPPSIADLDQDSLPEIVFGNFQGQVRVLNGEDGTDNWIIQADTFGNPIQTEPTIGDLNGDGDLDFVVANHFNTDGFHVWAYDYANQDTLWTYYRTADTSVLYHTYHGGIIADVDFDGINEYVVGTNDGMVYSLNGEDGSLAWQVSGLTNVISALSASDFDQDPALEIVAINNDYVNFQDKIRLIDGRTGLVDWSMPITFSAFRGAAISDINGNGMLDLVSGHYMGEIMAVEPFTGLLWTTDVDSFFDSGLPYLLLDHGPLIADFNQDNKLDIFTVAGYGTYFPDSLNTGMAFCFTAGDGTCPEWLMFRHDVQRTGYLSKAEFYAACGIVGQDDPQLSQMQVYPNPSQGTFEVAIPADWIDARFEVYDLQGRLVAARSLPSGVNGTFTMNLPAGLYVWKAINAESQVDSGKILIR